MTLRYTEQPLFQGWFQSPKVDTTSVSSGKRYEAFQIKKSLRDSELKLATLFLTKELWTVLSLKSKSWELQRSRAKMLLSPCNMFTFWLPSAHRLRGTAGVLMSISCKKRRPNSPCYHLHASHSAQCAQEKSNLVLITQISCFWSEFLPGEVINDCVWHLRLSGETLKLRHKGLLSFMPEMRDVSQGILLCRILVPRKAWNKSLDNSGYLALGIDYFA